VAPLAVNAATCVTASPSRGGIALKDWVGKRNLKQLPVTLYMSAWSLEELLALRQEAPDFNTVKEEDVRDLFALFGGNVRHCLCNLLEMPAASVPLVVNVLPAANILPAVERAKQWLQASLDGCVLEAMLEYLRLKQALTDKLDSVSHSLLQLIPTDDFCSFSYAFCSDYVRDNVLRRDAFAALDRFKALLATNTDAVFAAIRGQAYEAYVHRSFKELKFEGLRRLKLDGTVEDSDDLKFPAVLVQRVFEDIRELKDLQYGVPRSRSYASVDAVIKPNFAFQMSVTQDHDLKIDGLKAVKAGLGLSADQPLHVVMVCPPDVAPNVKWQHLTRGRHRVKRPQALVDGIGLCQYCLSFAWK